MAAFDTDAAHLELHQAPLRWLRVPARVHVISGFSADKEAAQIKARFSEFVAAFGLSDANIVWHENSAFARGNQDLIIKLDIGLNHFTFKTWDFAKAVSYDEAMACPLEAHLAIEDKLTELDILISDIDLGGRVEELLPGVDVLGSRILDNRFNVVTNFQPDGRGRERYLIYPVNRGDIRADQVEFIVDNIVHLENNFHLLSQPRSKYVVANERLRQIEKATADELSTIEAELPGADTEKLKSWLHSLTAGFAELAKMSERFNRFFADAVIYKEALRTIFAEFNERPLEGYAPLSAPILRSTTHISGEYARLLSRVESVRKQKLGIISILRTKIDLLQRDQSFALQQSMHETAKTQMSMQQSIEGLYVFIVAFYLTELARLIFEAMERRGIIHYSPVTLTALFIPVAILAGLILSGKAGHWWRRSKRSDAEETETDKP